MKAARILQVGPPEVITYDEMTRPQPRSGEVVVRVLAAGVGPWDALIRAGQSAVTQELPVILGSDLAGIVSVVGSNVSDFQPGDEIYGVTNKQFTGAYAEYAVASAGMIAPKPKSLNFFEAASAPVIAVTAWQMLFDYAHAAPGQSVLVHGGGGNVGAYAVQMARMSGLHVIATASTHDSEYVKNLGAEKVIDYQTSRFEDGLDPVDIVIDTVGGEIRERSYEVIKPGGILVTVVTPFPKATSTHRGIRTESFMVDVTTARLKIITDLFDGGKLVPHVGTVLPLAQAQVAHEMLAGAVHKPGKIVLKVAA